MGRCRKPIDPIINVLVLLFTLLFTNQMRIVTWNCRVGGFRKKARLIAPFKPDILAVQEVEPIDGTHSFASEFRPSYFDRPNFAAFPRRSTGMVSYNPGMELHAIDAPDAENLWQFGFRRYEANGGAFQVVGVWTFDTPANRRGSYRQAHKGLEEYGAWIRERPTVVLGDFNNTANYKNYGWRALEELVDSLGLVSAYHSHTGEKFGEEKCPTHFHKGHEKSAFHLDYCFLPKAWAEHISSVEVGDYNSWSEFSDHVPLIVDLNLPPMS